MQCSVCKKNLREGERVIETQPYVENPKRGDYVSRQRPQYIHVHHLKNTPQPDPKTESTI